MSQRERYVALGSSFAAGPGLRPRAQNSPRRSGRSEFNYAHRLAARLNYELVDASYSGATVRGMLYQSDRASEAQLQAVTSDTALITVTAGGNDVGYLPGLTLTSLPFPLRALPRIQGRIDTLRDPSEVDRRIAALERDYTTLVQHLRQQAPSARIVLVDYLTILPPVDAATENQLLPLPPEMALWGRHVADRLTATTQLVAQAEDVSFAGAAAASRGNHAWADTPWTKRFHLGLRGGAPYHPTLDGMQAVADLLSKALARDDR